jgi:D-xylulose reductase
MLAAARALGATRAIAIDIVPSRLAFAKEYAATDVWTPIKRQEEGNESEMEYAKRNAEGMKREFGFADVGPGAIDLVVDASGAKASIQTGIMIARAGGTYVQVRIKIGCRVWGHALMKEMFHRLEWGTRKSRSRSRPS